MPPPTTAAPFRSRRQNQTIALTRRPKAMPSITHFEHLFGKETDIDDANDPSGTVHYWKREEFIEDKKLARFQDGGARRDGDHAAHHYLLKPRLEWRGQQPPRGQDANKASFGI